MEADGLATPEVFLSKGDRRLEDNYYTVIIGNNGTGKSRFVSSLVSVFRGFDKKRRRGVGKGEYSLSYWKNGDIYKFEKKAGKRDGKKRTDRSLNAEEREEVLEKPSKIIAVSSAISDKFPLDGFRRKGFEVSKKDNIYEYLGPRSVIGASTRALMDRAITALIGNIGNIEYNESYRHIFSYLDYEPVVKLSYRLVWPGELKGILSEPTVDRFVKGLSDYASRRESFRGRSISKALEVYSAEYLQEISDTYINILSNSEKESWSKFYSLMINFSLKNVEREKSKLGDEEKRLYTLLEELRRFDLVRGPEVSLYKKNGSEFDFSDASSGEASILSSLIALIPSVEDGSLLVIDEPEISLHPRWQYRYVELLDKILKSKKGCHVVIATHSHFIVSDLPLERSSVIHFKEGNGRVVDVDYVDAETNGLSAEDVLLNIFGMPSTRNYYLSVELSKALEMVASGKTDNELFFNIVRRLKGYIPYMKDVDPLKDALITLSSLGGD
ncbi:AAA family ATPase [Cobetia sp. BMC6]|uniref:AAA family ATPase n=1 Tax=Cobetia TaxID=204286 RepID=UPI0015826338|nr:AAA family ATPase [Cobetia sp. BMC6]MDI4662639.1 ATP-binding protein [Cobetia sp. BMC6]NUJ57896.1 ATP-binding protein [Cobetia marina]